MIQKCDKNYPLVAAWLPMGIYSDRRRRKKIKTNQPKPASRRLLTTQHSDNGFCIFFIFWYRWLARSFLCIGCFVLVVTTNLKIIMRSLNIRKQSYNIAQHRVQQSWWYSVILFLFRFCFCFHLISISFKAKCVCVIKGILMNFWID